MLNLTQKLLQDEYAARKFKNSAYSLRAFSRDLQINRTTLSEVFSGKRGLSKQNRSTLAENLHLSPLEKNELLSFDLTEAQLDNKFQQLQEDEFKLIGDWFYFAILNLAKIKDNKAEPTWIGERLGIETETARIALDRLERLGYLKIKKNRIIRSSKPITTTTDVPSTALKKHHCQHLEMASRSLMNDPIDKREFTSVTMAIDPEKIPQVKKLLQKYKRNICNILETDEPQEVYQLSFQLYPIGKLQ